MATRYPILLVHGMVIKDLFFLRSFGRIGEALRAAGNAVYVSHQDGIGSIETNAAQLRDEITELLRKEGAEKVNLIAHSKGGLDCRYLISALGCGDKVASLTTLSTPHRGSRLAGKVMSMPNFLARLIAWWSNFFYRILGDRRPDLLRVGRQLSVDYLETFNREIENDEGVFYQSYSACMTGSKDDFLMKIPFGITKKLENEPTDGLVAPMSADWGEYRGNMTAESLSHVEMIGLGGKKAKKAAVAQFYATLASELAERGF